jgi:hypothetical protein
VKGDPKRVALFLFQMNRAFMLSVSSPAVKLAARYLSEFERSYRRAVIREYQGEIIKP